MLKTQILPVLIAKSSDHKQSLGRRYLADPPQLYVQKIGELKLIIPLLGYVILMISSSQASKKIPV
jgi:hypothetical protein